MPHLGIAENTPESPTRKFPNLFGLVIGIDNYKSTDIARLDGAVADAVAVRDYLSDELDVPYDHIQFLTDAYASREAIIHGFCNFKEDHRIQFGDPILIFFAGHGSELSSPLEWDAGGYGAKVQLIVPQDYCSQKDKEVMAIPDRTVAALIEQIASVRGDNITVILDCCYAASGTRGLPVSKNIIRSTFLPSRIHSELDKPYWNMCSRAPHTSPGVPRGPLTTHTLLAACNPSQIAIESEGRGNFTSALLKLLQNTTISKLRYCDILYRMDCIPGQNPQCEGANQQRFVFTTKTYVTPISYEVKAEKLLTGENAFVLSAGNAQGICTGDKFVVYERNDTAFEKPLGTLTAMEMSPLRTILKLQDGAPNFVFHSETAVAVQSRSGRRSPLPIYISQQEKWTNTDSADLFQKLNDIDDYDILTARSDHALLELSFEQLYPTIKNGTLRFPRLRCPKWLCVQISVDELIHYLRDAAKHFRNFFQIANEDPDITSDIRINFYKLEPTVSRFPNVQQADYLPTGSDLFDVQDNIIGFSVDPSSYYGLKLTNLGPIDLYPYVQYFNVHDLTIANYYEPPSSGRYLLDAPLAKRGGVLTIGYGAGGHSPFSYALPDVQEFNLGFLRICLANTPLVSALSPLYGPQHKWATVVIPVVQRRSVDIGHAVVPQGPHKRRASC